MSNIFNSEDFGLKIYNRFPPKYREDDTKQNYALRRYLQALGDGGFKYAIDEINGIANLIDPVNVDAKVLPVLFKQYGLEIFNGIPEEYLRYLLPRLGEAWSKKGSLGVVEFITSSLSGIKTSTEITYDSNENPIVGVRLEMDYNIGNYFPEVEQFNRLLKKFVPFYCDVGMLYSYLFYENQILVSKDDKNFITIHDTKDEICTLCSKSFALYKATLNNPNVELNNNFILNEIDGFIPDTDQFKDNVTHTILEESSLSLKAENSLTNINVLNSGFYTNVYNSYDIITKGNSTKVIFN